MRILYADSDESVLRSVEFMLRAEHFNIYGTTEGVEAIELGKFYDYDAIVLSDTNDVSFYDVIRALRVSRVRTPILVVASGIQAVSNTDVAVRVLNLGADAYMTKPFHKDELVANLHALVRRSKGHAQSLIVTGDLVVNIDSRIATVAGRDLRLTGKEFQMLELLALRKGQVQSKESILTYLYGGMDEPEVKIIDVFICKLRKKLAEHAGLIETVWGRGYLLREPMADSPSLAPELASLGEIWGGRVDVAAQVEETIAMRSPPLQPDAT